MTNHKDALHGGGVGQDRGPGPGREPGQGHGHASGRGRSPGCGKVCGHGGGKGRGCGRASNAVHRSENSSGSSTDGRVFGDFAPGRARNAVFRSNQPGKQPCISELHELLVGHRSFARGYSPKNIGANLTPSAFGNSTRRRQLSWADMRRQSQQSNSTADDSSEPDRSPRGFLNTSGSDGGWGGRGRGRILDSSSVKKFSSGEVNVDTSAFGGRGRGGILYVPGVHFHSGVASTRWKSTDTSKQGVMSFRHSVGGCATNSAHSFPQMFQRNDATGYSSNKQQNQKRQIWKKKKSKENKNVVKIDILQSVNSSEKGDSHAQGSFVPCIQRREEVSVINVENTEDMPSDGSKTVTGANKQIIDIISLAEGKDEKLIQNDVNNIEENLQKQLIIETDSVTRNTQMSDVPVICSTEQESDKKDNLKPIHSSLRGGHTRGIVLFGASIITDGGTADTRSAVTCERSIEGKSSDAQIILKSENNCNDKVCGAVV